MLKKIRVSHKKPDFPKNAFFQNSAGSEISMFQNPNFREGQMDHFSKRSDAPSPWPPPVLNPPLGNGVHSFASRAFAVISRWTTASVWFLSPHHSPTLVPLLAGSASPHNAPLLHTRSTSHTLSRTASATSSTASCRTTRTRASKPAMGGGERSSCSRCSGSSTSRSR